jgi:hypothetical protein
MHEAERQQGMKEVSRCKQTPPGQPSPPGTFAGRTSDMHGCVLVIPEFLTRFNKSIGIDVNQLVKLRLTIRVNKVDNNNQTKGSLSSH